MIIFSIIWLIITIITFIWAIREFWDITNVRATVTHPRFWRTIAIINLALFWPIVMIIMIISYIKGEI